MPQPPTAPQPADAFIEVSYPPPPSPVEIVPPKPSEDAVWLDGQWSWDGGAWVWQDGGWAIAPQGGGYARWALRREADGRLEFAPASWRDHTGRELPPARVLAVARKR